MGSDLLAGAAAATASEVDSTDPLYVAAKHVRRALRLTAGLKKATAPLEKALIAIDDALTAKQAAAEKKPTKSAQKSLQGFLATAQRGGGCFTWEVVSCN